MRRFLTRRYQEASPSSSTARKGQNGSGPLANGALPQFRSGQNIAAFCEEPALRA